MDLSFWRGKRVFLTGHTGFKGTWLSLWLQSLGAEITGFALPPASSLNLFEQTHAARGINSIIGDIRDLQALKSAMKAARPEIVIHMAAQALVRYSYENPVETYATNVMGTVHVLESVRHCKDVRAVVNVTTDKCYENREWDWGYRENEAMGGYDPYSNSKGCAELVTSAYRSSFFHPNQYKNHGVAVATARAGNVIGGGDWAQDRLIPDILRGFEQGQVVDIRNPGAIRPWQHVMEPLRGYMALAQALYERGSRYAEAWNFGPNDEDAKPVQWIVERMTALWGKQAKWQLSTGEHPHEANYLKLDVSKARNHLGWIPALRLNDALALIVDWSKQRLAGAGLQQLTLAQIKTYEARLTNAQ